MNPANPFQSIRFVAIMTCTYFQTHVIIATNPMSEETGLKPDTAVINSLLKSTQKFSLPLWHQPMTTVKKSRKARGKD